MITLANYDGIGEKTLEKAFNYVLNSPIWNTYAKASTFAIRRYLNTGAEIAKEFALPTQRKIVFKKNPTLQKKMQRTSRHDNDTETQYWKGTVSRNTVNTKPTHNRHLAKNRGSVINWTFYLVSPFVLANSFVLQNPLLAKLPNFV